MWAALPLVAAVPLVWGAAPARADTAVGTAAPTTAGVATVVGVAVTIVAVAAAVPLGRAAGRRLLRYRYPPVRAGPEAVDRWWAGMRPGMRARAAAHVDLGDLDGLPIDVRDGVNRDRLRTFLDEGSPTRRGMAGALAVSARLHHPHRPAARLLTFDPEGQGRLVMAIGDPATADHVVVYVPGMTHSLDLARYGVWRADALYEAARVQARPGDTVAVVYWLGYHPPRNLRGASFRAAARRGMHGLPRAVRGIRAVRRTPVHLTVVGHSYGSLLSGVTAARLGLPADDLVLIGSPGVGVAHASELGMPSDHVWASTATRDRIRHTPFLLHGLVPTSPAFGARIFDSGAGGRGARLPHGVYFEPDGPGVTNIARIATGRYSQVTAPGEPHDPGPAARRSDDVGDLVLRAHERASWWTTESLRKGLAQRRRQAAARTFAGVAAIVDRIHDPGTGPATVVAFEIGRRAHVVLRLARGDDAGGEPVVLAATGGLAAAHDALRRADALGAAIVSISAEVTEVELEVLRRVLDRPVDPADLVVTRATPVGGPR
jgi:hypothetical protein